MLGNAVSIYQSAERSTKISFNINAALCGFYVFLSITTGSLLYLVASLLWAGTCGLSFKSMRVLYQREQLKAAQQAAQLQAINEPDTPQFRIVS